MASYLHYLEHSQDTFEGNQFPNTSNVGRAQVHKTLSYSRAQLLENGYNPAITNQALKP